MSTRAVYTFQDTMSEYHVYKHHDGYPSGAAEFIQNALAHAWELPRFEADEFGAAFISANKDSAGGVRLTHGYDKHGDLEYRYEISAPAGALVVTAFSATDGPGPDYKISWRKIFKGSLQKFIEFAARSGG